MKTPPPDTQPAAETLEEIAEGFVADLPPSTDCAFNVAKKGLHRFCSRMGRERVGGYYFCRHHANVVAKVVLEGRKGK